MKRISLICVSALFLAQTPPVSAEMYRWTDVQGNVVYSQSPPPDDRPAATIKPPPGPSAEESEAARQRLDRQIERLNTENEQKLKAKEEQSKKKKEAEANRQRCEQAKKNLEILTSRPPNTLYGMDGGKDYKRFTTEEYDKQVKSYKETISKYCGK